MVHFICCPFVHNGNNYLRYRKRQAAVVFKTESTDDTIQNQFTLYNVIRNKLIQLVVSCHIFFHKFGLHRSFVAIVQSHPNNTNHIFVVRECIVRSGCLRASALFNILFERTHEKFVQLRQIFFWGCTVFMVL